MGWPAFRKAEFKEQVTKLNGIWATVCANIASELNVLLTAAKDRLIETIGKVFKDFYDGFNSFCDAKDGDNPQEKLIRDHLQTNLEKAQKILDGPMKRAYEALERDFRRIGVTSE